MKATALALLLSAVIAGKPNAATIEIIDAPGGGVVAVEPGTPPLVRTADGRWWQMHGRDFAPAKPPPDPPRDGDEIPHSRPVFGMRDIADVRLVGPTDRYGHGVLGDAIEASAMRVRRADGTRFDVTLAEDAVFEDLAARLADLDGDGRDEVIVVRSGLTSGARLTVWGLDSRGHLIERAAGPALGRHRWQNPVGAADLDADGNPEIVTVLTPHIGGIVVAYRYEAGRLTELGRIEGYSSHTIGSPELRLATFLDADGDGNAEVALPPQGRRGMAILDLEDGAWRRMDHVAHDPPVTTAVAVIAAGGSPLPDLLYGLADGRLVLWVR